MYTLSMPALVEAIVRWSLPSTETHTFPITRPVSACFITYLVAQGASEAVGCAGAHQQAQRRQDAVCGPAPTESSAHSMSVTVHGTLLQHRLWFELPCSNGAWTVC